MSVMANRQNQVQHIKEVTDIVDLISQYTTLTPAGKRLKGLSPFTNEKTPSFFVDPDTGVYYCFSSQKGGDIFSFVQETEGVGFREALHILAERAGINLETASADTKQSNAPLYHALEAAAAVYQNNLTKEVKTYLINRGIHEQTIQEWGIGYAPDKWNTICSANTPNLTEQVTAGICIENKEKKSTYDRFRNRVQFPFHDGQHRVIGFSGRMYGEGEGAKYINSPESPLFNKSSFLYGLHKAKPHIRKHNVAILTEGPIDAIMVHQAGYPMAVATSGTAVTERHLQTLQRLSNRLLILFDGDAAGQRAALRVIEMAFTLGIDSKVVPLPDGKDPADVIKENVQQFKDAIKNALPATTFLTQHIAKMYGESGEDCIRGIKEVLLPIIAKNKDPLLREYAVKEIATFSGLSAEAITKSLEQIKGSSVIQDAKPTLRRKKTITPAENARTRQQQKIDALLNVTAMAIHFLEEKNIPHTDIGKNLLSEIQKTEILPKPDKKVVRMRYEVEFADVAAQTQSAHNELEAALKLLIAERKKQQEIEKLRAT